MTTTMMTAGSFLAKKIELEDGVADDELEGVVFSVDSATQFKMVVVEELRDVTGVTVGDPITITLNSGTQFQVDTNGLTVPAGLLGAFTGATDTSQLISGQAVQVRKVTLTPGPPITVATNRVRLRMTRFTGKVAGAPAPPNFNVNNLPALFGPTPGTTILVQTSSRTRFEGGITGVSGLADSNNVSVRGLYFKSTPNNTAIADKVRKRP
jgi:hypothetical protein